MQDNFQQRKVLKALEHEPLTASEIARACDWWRYHQLDLAKACRVLNGMLKTNMVMKTGRVYSLQRGK